MSEATGEILELPRIDFARRRAVDAIRLAVTHEGARREARLPVLSWGGGRGPGTLVIAGQHGNEYQGVIILQRIIERLGGALAGNLIIVPAVNPSALRAATRTSPHDGLDLNRSFPGAVDGSPTRQIAHAISTALLPHVEVVLDIHSGGYGSAFIPGVMMHYLAERDQFRRMVSASRKFDLPVRVLIDESQKIGMFDTLVETQGKLFYCPELGGGMLTPEVLEVGYRFVESFLAAFGHLDRAPPARPPRLLEVPDQDHWIKCDADGVFAPLVMPGRTVKAGQPLGTVMSLEDPSAPARAIPSPYDGVVYIVKVGGRVLPDQSIAVVAHPARRRHTAI